MAKIQWVSKKASMQFYAAKIMCGSNKDLLVTPIKIQS